MEVHKSQTGQAVRSQDMREKPENILFYKIKRPGTQAVVISFCQYSQQHNISGRFWLSITIFHIIYKTLHNQITMLKLIRKMKTCIGVITWYIYLYSLVWMYACIYIYIYLRCTFFCLTHLKSFRRKWLLVSSHVMYLYPLFPANGCGPGKSVLRGPSTQILHLLLKTKPNAQTWFYKRTTW